MGVMKNILYIEDQPAIRTYQYNAYVESILASHKDYENWIASNYIQVAFYENNISSRSSSMDYFSGSVFGSIPLLEYEDFRRKIEIVDNEAQVHEVLQNALNSKQYIYTFLDEYYVPDRISTGKVHQEHDVLIYGYDLDKRVYYIIGYNRDAQYLTHVIGFEQFYQGFCNDNSCVFFLKIKETGYEFNLNKFKEMLLDYRYGRDSREYIDRYFDLCTYNEPYFDTKFDGDICFGIKSYQCLLDRMRIQGESLDYRILYLIAEHKKNMLSKVNYLVAHNYLSNAIEVIEIYQNMIKQSETNIYLLLKYYISKNEEILDKIKKTIESLEEQEEKVLDILLNQITHYNDKAFG